jgi:hypothetical protein
MGINNSTAKSIFYKYKQTGQIYKHPRAHGKVDGSEDVASCADSDKDQHMAEDQSRESPSAKSSLITLHTHPNVGNPSALALNKPILPSLGPTYFSDLLRNLGGKVEGPDA